MAGAIRYLASPKAGVERVNPHVVAGLDREGEAITPDAIPEVAGELDAARLLSGTEVSAGHVWACSLTLSEAEGALGDERWREIAEGFMQRMSFGDVRWVAVHHGPNAGGGDHVHIVATMVQDDGRRANEWQYLRRASRAVTELERVHGLQVLESRAAGAGAALGAHQVELDQAKAMAEPEPARSYLERVVRATASEARDEHEFASRLRNAGVKVRPRYAAGSRDVVGYSVAVGPSPWYGGGRLARDLSLPRLRERWATPAGERLDWQAHEAAGKLAASSVRSERRPGPLARESREVARFAQTRASSTGLLLSAAMAAALRERISAAERECELARERAEFEERREAERRWTPRAARGQEMGL